LLDLGLPEKSGLQLLKELRASNNATPVLIVTARDDVETRVAGLDLGADDFVVKPFDFEELAARMRAVLRRHAGHISSEISSADVTLNLATREIRYGGTTQVLPAREYALLRALMERPGAILSRTQLEDALYGWGDEVESNAVDVLIYYIRRKFGKGIIKNVRGVGWMVPK
jgi:DNA-binding response OmpR family regulator